MYCWSTSKLLVRFLLYQGSKILSFHRALSEIYIKVLSQNFILKQRIVLFTDKCPHFKKTKMEVKIIKELCLDRYKSLAIGSKAFIAFTRLLNTPWTELNSSNYWCLIVPFYSQCLSSYWPSRYPRRERVSISLFI